MRRIITGETVQLHPIAEISQRPNWRAGIEPGLDPTKENGGLPSLPTPPTPCVITAVDFDQENISINELTNDSLHNYLAGDRGKPSICRWINVSGLDWDVIQTIALKYDLSHLALEDLLNTKSRTKVEWYKNHMFIVLTLQKIMQIKADDAKNEAAGSTEPIASRSLSQKIRKFFSNAKADTVPNIPNIEEGKLSSESVESISNPYRTIQDYNGGENRERVDFLESQSLLKQRDLEVSVEQVSIFVTGNNEVISFFESSGHEIEGPIMKRLLSDSTLLRQTADATMIAQGLVDGIIDLAFPVNTAFKNALDQMEINVLTERPNETYLNLFYILKSEMMALKNLMSPITKMIQTLRNHRNTIVQSPFSTVCMNHAIQTGQIPPSMLIPSSVVKISELTNTYLGDVEDHCISIEDSLNQMLNASNEISDLIFIRLNIDTNKTMKTLTTFTVILLPMTFLTGYFGMNFTKFGSIQHSDLLFWEIATPIMVIVTLIFTYQDIKHKFFRSKQKGICGKKRVTRQKRHKIANFLVKRAAGDG